MVPEELTGLSVSLINGFEQHIFKHQGLSFAFLSLIGAFEYRVF